GELAIALRRHGPIVPPGPAAGHRPGAETAPGPGLVRPRRAWYKPPMADRSFRLASGARVLFLTKDPELIRRQIRGELELTLDQVGVEDLLDDINTDAMTPAWVCFDHDPEIIARNAYAGLIVDGERLLEEDALRRGNFQVRSEEHTSELQSRENL